VVPAAHLAAADQPGGARIGVEGALQGLVEESHGVGRPARVLDVGHLAAIDGQDAVRGGGAVEAGEGGGDGETRLAWCGLRRRRRRLAELIELGRLALREDADAAAQGDAQTEGRGEDGREAEGAEGDHGFTSTSLAGGLAIRPRGFCCTSLIRRSRLSVACCRLPIAEVSWGRPLVAKSLVGPSSLAIIPRRSWAADSISLAASASLAMVRLPSLLIRSLPLCASSRICWAAWSALCRVFW